MLNKGFLSELQHEATSTKKILERVPEDKLDWKPHEKSMTLGRLATHIAELTRFITIILTSDELDFATGKYKPTIAKSSEELLQIFREKLDGAIEALKNASDEKMRENWSLRNGEQIFFTLPRMAAIRGLAMNHIIHHRGQLSVYLRLLDVPVPGMYGPTADE